MRAAQRGSLAPFHAFLKTGPLPMNFYEAWNKALKKTEIIRSRVTGLHVHSATDVPYILLSASSVNPGDTVVRQGKVLIEKPSLIVPPSSPQFEGFEFDRHGHSREDSAVNYLLVRGVRLPSMRYNNQTCSLDVREGSLDQAVRYYHDVLQRGENVQSGLITGPEDCWQFSLLLFVCSQVARNAEADIKGLLEENQDRKGRE